MKLVRLGCRSTVRLLSVKGGEALDGQLGIRSLNELGDHAGANAMIRDLGDYFRYSISCDTPMVLLKEGIAFTQAYCNILRRKYCDDIRFEWKCDPSALEMPVLRLLMQPLIENAVYHGLAPRGTKGTVRISVRLQEAFLLLEISDDGCGMDKGNLRQRIGLTNVRRRIELLRKKERWRFTASSAQAPVCA